MSILSKMAVVVATAVVSGVVGGGIGAVDRKYKNEKQFALLLLFGFSSVIPRCCQARHTVLC